MSDIFDEHAEKYSENIDGVLGKYGANHDFFTNHKARLIKRLLQSSRREPRAMRLLDVGCGVGKIHALLENDFKSINGVDVSSTSIEVARAAHPKILYDTYDGDQLPFEAEKFDVAIAICVFHHVPPPQWIALAREMLRVLRPGGISLVIEHNPYNPVTRRVVNTCALDADAVLLSARKLKEVFREAGSDEIVSRTILSVPPKTTFLEKIDDALGGLPFGAQYYMVATKHGFPPSGREPTSTL